MKNCNSIFLSCILFVCLITFSLATKHNSDQPESSSQASKRRKTTEESETQNIKESENFYMNIDNYIGDALQAILSLIDSIDILYSECSVEVLDFEYIKLDEKEATKIIRFCNFQAELWLKIKNSRIGKIGTLITRWLTAIQKTIQPDRSKLYTMLEIDWRDYLHSARRLQNTWRIRNNRSNQFGKDITQNSSHAYKIGDGFCIHMLSPPFDRIEKFMQVVVEKFQHLKYVQRFASEFPLMPTSLQIYIFQKLCRRFDRDPRSSNINFIAFVPHSIANIEMAREMLKRRMVEIQKYEQKFPDKCNWFGIMRRKYQYRLLRVLINTDFKYMKQLVDDSIDEFVTFCLSKYSEKNIDEIFEKIKDTPRERLVPIVTGMLRLALESYNLPPEQSINSVLDIRSSSNDFKEHFLNIIRQNIKDEIDLERANFFNELLEGKLSDFETGIFREPIYMNEKLVENNLLEFLFHVFDIKGYKPQFSSPLLDFYYLYKISEICNMIPIGKTAKKV